MSKTETEALEIEASALENSLDELTAAIDRVEHALRRFLFKARTKTAIPQEEGESARHFLVWDWHEKKGWSLQVLTRSETDDEVKTTLLVSAPWRLRVRATTCFEALLVQASLELRQQNKDVRDAIVRCAAFSKKIQDPT